VLLRACGVELQPQATTNLRDLGGSELIVHVVAFTLSAAASKHKSSILCANNSTLHVPFPPRAPRGSSPRNSAVITQRSIWSGSQGAKADRMKTLGESRRCGLHGRAACPRRTRYTQFVKRRTCALEGWVSAPSPRETRSLGSLPHARRCRRTQPFGHPLGVPSHPFGAIPLLLACRAWHRAVPPKLPSSCHAGHARHPLPHPPRAPCCIAGLWQQQ
jgi:hypothetical protein